MLLNEAGGVVRRCWENVPDHFPLVQLDAFVVMPNHVHGIIVIRCRGEASVPPHVFEEQPGSDASPLRQRPNGTRPGSLPAIVQNFKSISTRKTNAAHDTPCTPIWQRGFYEHIIRNEAELAGFREYIVGNPARWEEDENNPDYAKR